MSSSVDLRTPVIVGVGQRTWRPGGEPVPDRGPVAMMADAVSIAADDSGAGRKLLDQIQSLQVVNVIGWRFNDAAAMVAGDLGITPNETVYTTVGGNTPQMLVNRAADRIRNGDLDVAAIVGVEAMYTRNKLRKAAGGEKPNWPAEPDGAQPTLLLGDQRPGVNDRELSLGLVVPTTCYPVFENAIRADKGLTIEEHRQRIGGLWSRFSQVAANNPHAWSPTALDPDTITTPGPGNRMISFPYAKYLNANMQVDQSAAVIICTAAAARAAGIPEDQWVFPWAGAEAYDHFFVSNRHSLHSSPAIKAIGESVFGRTGTTADDIAHVDIYSCFPSAVQVGADALGFRIDDPDRPLTLTGGLTFGGGPGNNYVTHSLAAMVEACRAEPGSMGMVTANGWYLTKHGAGIYSTTPPPQPFAWEDVQPVVDAQPSRELAPDDVAGAATVESYTVNHDRDGNPTLGIVAALLPDGRRAWATTADADITTAMTQEEFIGREATLQPGGQIAFA